MQQSIIAIDEDGKENMMKDSLSFSKNSSLTLT